MKGLESLRRGHVCAVTFPLISPFCSCNFPLFRNNTLPHGELSPSLVSILLFLHEYILPHCCHRRLHIILCSTCTWPIGSKWELQLVQLWAYSKIILLIIMNLKSYLPYDIKLCTQVFMMVPSNIFRSLADLPKFFWPYPMSYISYITWSIQVQNVISDCMDAIIKIIDCFTK